jgi:putative phage-type endonuclease
LKSKPQPEQRTNEWYEFRHNLITASNAYKAFESDAMKNQLIYEKCQPIKTVSGSSDSQNQSKQININTPFHWGQKYEPVSVMIYEYTYNTKIGDFGCIKHDKYSFLGASPDGINIDPNSEKYGVMLEIKNIVNREITGIPKKEYWVQTQLQMETCDLDECDFLETRFIEYENENAFLMDTDNNQNIEKTSKNEYKGVIMYFANKDGNPFYVYKPMNIKTYLDFQKWEETEMERLESIGYIWIKNLYWRLDCISCVLIKRNTKWFNENLHFLEELWKTVEYERVHGYTHRAPKSSKKQTKNRIEPTVSNKSICLIKINSHTGDAMLDKESEYVSEPIPISTNATKTVQISSTTNPNTNPVNKPNTLQFFKIRTQSFDESKNNTN